MKYVLDTSAILAFYQGEPEAAAVAGIFEAADKGEASILVSFMTIFELIYLAIARAGTQEALSLLFKVRNLGVDEIWPDEDLVWKAGEIKARGGLSAADAFIAGSAAVTGAVLVHVDPEFDRLGPEVQTLNLGLA
jgi:predicted nucleic acid-binding protein